MGAYILRRMLLVIPTLLGIMIVNFTLVHFVPGQRDLHTGWTHGAYFKQLLATRIGTGHLEEVTFGGRLFCFDFISR